MGLLAHLHVSARLAAPLGPARSQLTPTIFTPTRTLAADILTELAFWAVAFPVASATFYSTAGHWPDLGDGSDRTAVLAFIFAGANVARLVVPVRFGVAFALAPWVDENIVQKLRPGVGAAEGGESNERS
jgi:hypothetical protein